MSKSFSELKKKMSPLAQQLALQKTKHMLSSMPLQELRRTICMSQEKLAANLASKQASVSRLEKRTDMYISTLRGYIEAIGGELDIIARFPEGDVHINQFKVISNRRNSLQIVKRSQ